jgi:hypothetical protein
VSFFFFWENISHLPPCHLLAWLLAHTHARTNAHSHTHIYRCSVFVWQLGVWSSQLFVVVCCCCNYCLSIGHGIFFLLAVWLLHTHTHTPFLSLLRFFVSWVFEASQLLMFILCGCCCYFGCRKLVRLGNRLVSSCLLVVFAMFALPVLSGGWRFSRISWLFYFFFHYYLFVLVVVVGLDPVSPGVHFLHPCVLGWWFCSSQLVFVF